MYFGRPVILDVLHFEGNG